ncbi:MAG TPA: hypothetical protein PKW35_26075 [Nannocystaceae bacterium]|nr:hypothetical protein [Nannocystaceae bacterium]
MRRKARPLLLAAACLLAAPWASAEGDRQVVWKLVDKKGKVTYVDKAPPKEFDGKVTRIEVDLKANSAMLVTVGEASKPVRLPLTAPELRRVRADAELARAREVLEAAKKAREDGKDPTPEETRWLGKKGGGARPEPTEAYHARIKSLDDAVKAAEAEVDRAQKAARMAAID